MARPPTARDVLKKRGSRAKSTKRPAPKALAVSGKVPLPDIDWPTITRLIPGYDPWVNADGFRFDADKANAVADFFWSKLTHVKGSKARQPFILEPWQLAVVGNLFGWVEDGGERDGLRRYQKVLLYIPRKNGKTPLAAGLILYLLGEDGEPGAEVYGCAREYNQASLVWHHARGMVAQSPDLDGKYQIFKGQAKAIELRLDHSVYSVRCSDSLSAHGWNTHAGVIDELHTQKDDELVEALETSTAARQQPVLFYLTTADFDRPSVCNDTHDYACKVRDGIIDDRHFLPVVYEATKDDDWTSPDTWAKANPNLGVSVTRQYIEAAYAKACEVTRFENTFKRLHLNIRTEQDVRWIQMSRWDRCVGAGITPDDLLTLPCYAGLDLSTTTDITALALVFPLDDGRVAVLPHFWVPGESARAREKRDKVPYVTWAQEGWVTLTDGEVVNYDYIRASISGPDALDADCLERAEAAGITESGLAEQYNIREIAFDRYNSSQLVTQLGGDGHEMVMFGQGFVSMSAPAKELEKLIVGDRLVHFGNPVLRWMASNASIETDAAGNIKPSKKKSTEKIDGIVALVMALGRAIQSAQPKQSVYEDRGILMV